MVIIGRYFSGDIEGKFWFAVQSSTDGENFGAVECNSGEINYEVEDIETVKTGLSVCITDMRKYKAKIDKFFKNCHSYTDKELAEYLKVDMNFSNYLLKIYARFKLGKKDI